MRERIIEFVEDLKEKKEEIVSYNEAEISQGIVLQLLPLLGWDTSNIKEVCPEYSVGSRRVDYSLRIKNANKVFIEAKKGGEDLETHQEQLLDYCFRESVELATLTNGVIWWFYMPLRKGSWEQRKFYAINIIQQETEDITSRFIDFLFKENVESGKAVKNAESIYKSRQKEDTIKKTLYQAWQKIISEPDDMLVDLIAETTANLCGHKPDEKMVKDFLSKHKTQLLIRESPAQSPKVVLPPRAKRIAVSPTRRSDFSGKKISTFYFQGVRYEIRNWQELLIRLCEVIADIQGADFNEQTLSRLTGYKRPYFTHNANRLRVPRRIKNTNLFVEAHWSVNGVVKLCFELLDLFGYSKNDLKIEAR